MHPIPIPQPLVTDLDGDGKSEVVVLSDDRMTIRVLSIPPASGETLVSHVLFRFASFRFVSFRFQAVFHGMCDRSMTVQLSKLLVRHVFTYLIPTV